MLDIKELKFDAKGLIPAIVYDNDTKKVLTLAYMSEESLKISMEKNSPVFSAVQEMNCGSKVRQAVTISISYQLKRTVIRMRF